MGYEWEPGYYAGTVRDTVCHSSDGFCCQYNTAWVFAVARASRKNLEPAGQSAFLLHFVARREAGRAGYFGPSQRLGAKSPDTAAGTYIA
jgi:hypothetical protein